LKGPSRTEKSVLLHEETFRYADSFLEARFYGFRDGNVFLDRGAPTLAERIDVVALIVKYAPHCRHDE